MKRLFLLCIILIASQLSAQENTTYHYAYISQWIGQQYPVLVIIDLDSELVTPISIPADIVTYDTLISPDGEWVTLMPEYHPNREYLVLYNVKTQEMQEIPVSIGQGRDHSGGILGKFPLAAWSSDSHYLAYVSFQDGQNDVFVYSISTGETINITDDTLRHGSLTWGNNQYLAFASEDCGAMTVGCSVVVEVFDVINQVQVASVAVPKRHGIEEGGFCDLQLSPDNDHISFVRHCAGTLTTTEEIYVTDIGSSEAAPLTNFTETGYLITNAPSDDPGWYWRFAAYDVFWQDNETLLVGTSVMIEEPGKAIERTYRYNLADNTEPEIILDSMVQQWAYNPVLGQIAFRSVVGYLQETTAQIQLAAIENGNLEIIGNYPAGCYPQWSPDYRILAFTKHREHLGFDDCDQPITGIYFLDTDTNTLIERDLINDNYALPVGWINFE